MNCWLNLYKPKGISSARLVSIVKKRITLKTKIGHAGTLDLEAEGVLPLAIGEATKLVQFLMEARKEYIFTVKFGAKTDTADFAGQVIETTDHIPTETECRAVCQKFIGDITQVPPNFSALKVNGMRAYDLARQGKEVKLNPRSVHIYQFNCLNVDQDLGQATYHVECSKGTYVRTLAEDVALSLQSLGFVLELRRTRVGIFTAENAIMLSYLELLDQGAALQFLEKNNMKIEAVLDDILVLEADQMQAQKIRFGQKCYFNNDPGDISLLWVKYEGRILAIGSLQDNCFISSRVFNVN